jgi:GNAT superfamily N-acetyltransferase
VSRVPREAAIGHREADPRTAAVLHARRELHRRAAGQAMPVPGGIVLRCPELPDVPDLNALHLDAPAPAELTGAALQRLAARGLDGLPHHHVVLDDAAAGERLGTHLQPAGWARRRVGVMVQVDGGTAPPPAVEVRRLPEAALIAVQHAALAQEAPDGLAAGVLEQLAQGVRRLRCAATCWAGFGVIRNGAAVASASLLLDTQAAGRRPIALIEEVGTLRVHREQGLGRAVVLAAVRAARAAGAQTVAVCVDADDWPQLMYARLGFVTAGRQIALTRPI